MPMAPTSAAMALLCKFTPMEFETHHHDARGFSRHGVNLLRWSLKQIHQLFVFKPKDTCKFTPMEFETLR